MNLGMSVCVLLAALFSSSLSLPSQTTVSHYKRFVLLCMSETLATPSEDSHTRQVRSVGSELSHDETEASNTLNQLLVKLLSRKESHPRSSLSSRASGLAPGHRIKDRDYLGWMDFGRRSAEEYEYAS
uniref:Gastrin/cholecystokinin peptide hormone domain-containing protein n=1 Tax=Periophthalmus magnuspinnatus TaxID=409849 RepID=A0A3B4BCB3_9GOBI